MAGLVAAWLAKRIYASMFLWFRRMFPMPANADDDPELGFIPLRCGWTNFGSKLHLYEDCTHLAMTREQHRFHTPVCLTCHNRSTKAARDLIDSITREN